MVHRNNISLAKKGRSWEEVYGKEKADELKKIVSLRFKGIPKTKAHNLKNSQSQKLKIQQGIINPLKGKDLRPTKPERLMMEIIEEKNFPFTYVGDGKWWIGNFNPDFICFKAKLVLEVYGDYWHNREDSKARDKDRLKMYKNRGWDTLIVWEKELGNKEEVIKKVNNFIIK